jgi:hypothetical protein
MMRKHLPKRILTCFLLPILILFSLGACKKEQEPELPAEFTWNVYGADHNAAIFGAYLSGFHPGGPVITGTYDFGNGPPSHFEIGPGIVLPSLARGKYVSGQNIIWFYYQTGSSIGVTGMPASVYGEVNITMNKNNKISGNFSGSLDGGGSLTGKFTNIPIVP